LPETLEFKVALEIDNRNNPLAEDIRTFSRFGPAISSAGRAICDAVLLPLFMMIIAWQMAPAYELMTLKGSLHHAIMVIAPMTFLTLLLLYSFRKNGLAHKHFAWSEKLCRGMRNGLRCVAWVVLPLKFLCESLSTFQNGVWYDSLGRLFFLICVVAISLALYFACSGINRWRDDILEAKGLKRSSAQRRQYRENLFNGGPVDVDMMSADAWKAPLRRFALMIVALIPMILAGLSIAGYHFTATQMTERAIWTILLSGLIAVFAGLVGRMLLVTQFRVKLRQLKRNDGGFIGEDESISISEISSQVNRLLRVTAFVGIVIVAWQIWSEVSPTIRYLDSVELWDTKKPDGTIAVTTWSHMLMSIGVICISLVLSRNLPGLLELTLIDRLPLDKGGRYAISFVIRYLVGLVGILLAFKVIGFSWSSVQWLAAGLTVGLGFGLQEIFANLVSGIIILIERPVRVGDFVTVNGTTGTVSQMQLRATTIRDLDMRELIVPNKKFITDDVMNWTLSDKLARLILKVGVAYESDTDKVEQALLTVAARHPLVLGTPRPEVIFQSFGDSTLDFELRVILPKRDLFPRVKHELNMSINSYFREQGIEVAFPQREIRVRTEDAGKLAGRKAA
jgi:potassium efflux system protein